MLIIATILSSISAPIGLVLPLLTGKVIDAAMLSGGLVHLRQIVLWFIGACVILAALSYGSNYLINSIGMQVLRDLRLRLFSHVIHLSQDFHEKLKAGELLSRISSDLTLIQSFLTGAIPAAIPATIILFSTIVIMSFIHVKLTMLSLLLMLPPSGAVAAVIGRVVRKLSVKQQDALAGSTAFVEEAINGIRTIQSAGREQLEINRYSDKLATLLKIQSQNIWWGSITVVAARATQLTSAALVLWYGGYLIINHELSPGQLVTFMLLCSAQGGAVVTFFSIYTNYKNMVGVSVRVFEILETQAAIKDPVDAAPASLSEGAIAFRNVRFRYPLQKDHVALNGIHIEIQAREMVGLVGPSGSGKSTLFSLLLRFYDASEGIISIDGIDLRSIRLRDLRRTIGIVPQEIFIFSGTVADNISYFKPEATPEEVRVAAAAAGADEFIERLPKRYDEFVGERGVKLSTGQRQRIAIARAFIINPTILLMDEATSSLDAESEEKVSQGLSRLMERRTTLVIAHRLATARRANRILVMERGSIIGSGTHDVLYETNKLYRRFWDLQSLEGFTNNGNTSAPVF